MIKSKRMRFRPAKALFALLFTFCLVSVVWIYFSPSSSTVDNDGSIIFNSNDVPLPQILLKDVKSLFNSSLLKTVMNSNEQFLIRNSDKFSQIPDYVIVVQVHRRIDYLKILIGSLRSVREIEKCLVIFSHDYYDENINQLIQTIDFTLVTQIFYPFSNQIWFKTFPGKSLNDCPARISKQKALSIGCGNAQNPDTYGNYRETTITQIKHHWWWKINHIFEHFSPLHGRNFELAMIEEDHYLVPDFLMIWKHLSKLREKHVVDLISLGNYEKNLKIKKMDGVQLTDWWSSKHNLGIVIDQKFWQEIKWLSKEFCNYDDYNWDWTLQYLVKKNIKRPVKTLMPSFPRVVHFGSCGLHAKNSDCSPGKIISELETILLERQNELFPSEMILKIIGGKRGTPKINGGWGDIRDQKLCSQYSQTDLQIIKSDENFYLFLQ